jgi:NADH:ubiquinone oxidoreductase subunit 3 (subunit A)
MYSQRSIILLVVTITFGLASLILLVNYLLSEKNLDEEKITPYECGFSPYGEGIKRMDIQYYLVGILFLIFDLEVSFIFPFTQIELVGYEILLIFLVILTIGFVYE